MAEGWWGKLMDVGSSIPGVGMVPAGIRGVTQAAEGKDPATSFSEMIPGYGSSIALGQLASGGKGLSDVIANAGKSKGSGGGGTSTTDTTIPPPAGSTTGTTSPADNALMMGIGMFFQNYLAPLLAQQNASNQTLTNQAQSAMTQALGNPMPAGVKQTLEAQQPQDLLLQRLANQAGYQQAMGTIPFQQTMQAIGGETSGMGALTDAFTKWANNIALYGGTTGPLSSALQQAVGGPNTLAGQLAGVVGQSGTGLTAGLGSVGGVPGTGVGTTPGAGTTGTTGTTGSTTNVTPTGGAVTAQQQAAVYQQAVKNGTLTAAQAESLLEQLNYTAQQAQQIVGSQ